MANDLFFICQSWQSFGEWLSPAILHWHITLMYFLERKFENPDELLMIVCKACKHHTSQLFYILIGKLSSLVPINSNKDHFCMIKYFFFVAAALCELLIRSECMIVVMQWPAFYDHIFFSRGILHLDVTCFS